MATNTSSTFDSLDLNQNSEESVGSNAKEKGRVKEIDELEKSAAKESDEFSHSRKTDLVKSGGISCSQEPKNCDAAAADDDVANTKDNIGETCMEGHLESSGANSLNSKIMTDELIVQKGATGDAGNSEILRNNKSQLGRKAISEDVDNRDVEFSTDKMSKTVSMDGDIKYKIYSKIKNCDITERKASQHDGNCRNSALLSSSGDVSFDENKLKDQTPKSEAIGVASACALPLDSSHAKPQLADEEKKEQEENSDDDLEFVTDHFADSSEDELKEVLENKALMKDLSDVGRYSYACLIAHSLHTLFGYSTLNRKFQEQCIKQLLRRLGQTKKMLKTMMMVVSGDITMEGSDPLVDTLKREFPNPHIGALLIIEDLLEMTLKDGVYDARMRTLLKFVSLVLGIVWDDVEKLEDKIQERFQDDGHIPTEEEMKEKADKMKSRRFKRIALVSVAAVGGGALIGLTAGLAAPLIAVGAGAIIGGVGAAGLGTVAGAAIIGSIFGVAGAGLTGYKMKKRIGELEEFEFEPLTQGRCLHVTIAVSGWLNDKHTDFRSVWLGLDNSREQYNLRYESKYLRELGNAMEYIANIAITAAVKHTLKQTLLSGLLAAISWPLTLLSVASIIDNPWSICTQRSTNAGRQMAEVLLSRQQGRRPVTLIGFSFGARVIFSCLEEMAVRKNSEGIVEDVVLLGAPVSGCTEDWSRLEKVVSGRIVNGYCRGDWLLKFMYRTASAQLTIAGLTPVKWENRRMHNVDLTDIVTGHLDYFNQIDTILNAIGIKTVEHAEVGSSESLKQWTSLRRADSEIPTKNPQKTTETKEAEEPLAKDVPTESVNESDTVSENRSMPSEKEKVDSVEKEPRYEETDIW